jgi:hypothetical protein
LDTLSQKIESQPSLDTLSQKIESQPWRLTFNLLTERI